MKRTAIAIAVGALSTGLAHGVLAQDDTDPLRQEQQMTQEGAQEHGNDQEGTEGRGTGFDPQDQGQQPYGDDNGDTDTDTDTDN